MPACCAQTRDPHLPEPLSEDQRRNREIHQGSDRARRQRAHVCEVSGRDCQDAGERRGDHEDAERDRQRVAAAHEIARDDGVGCQSAREA
jgi:hypothetical protein